MVMQKETDIKALVSVVIPCYNQARFIGKAIQSILKQSYENFEIIVIDDGSTDNCREVVAQFKEVKYFYQQNKGLSAARNRGIEESHGDYLVFLDADDWLFEDALEINLSHIVKKPELAFVSGGHIKVNEQGDILETVGFEVPEKHYSHFLKGNYIGMHATVMYRKWVFSKMKFDESLRKCEDYDLYLKISRKFEVLHHTENLAAYRIHNQSMSADQPAMLNSVLKVLHRQKAFLKGNEEFKMFRNGLKVWPDYYCGKMYKNLNATRVKELSKHKTELYAIVKFRFPLALRLFAKKTISALNKIKTRVIGDRLSKWITTKPISFGGLNRITPFSNEFGYDRGGPVDRIYIEDFLERKKHLVTGRVMEIGDNEYTKRFGGSKVNVSDILHVNPENKNATLIGDLSTISTVPDNSFDCIILTQTLHLIFDYQKAIDNCYRMLKPGAVLLITVPGISQIDRGEWKNNWLWSFTTLSVEKILTCSFQKRSVSVSAFGNVYIATAFLYGLGAPEIDLSKLYIHDESYPVIITASAVK